MSWLPLTASRVAKRVAVSTPLRTGDSMVVMSWCSLVVVCLAGCGASRPFGELATAGLRCLAAEGRAGARGERAVGEVSPRCPGVGLGRRGDVGAAWGAVPAGRDPEPPRQVVVRSRAAEPSVPFAVAGDLGPVGGCRRHRWFSWLASGDRTEVTFLGPSRSLSV